MTHYHLRWFSAGVVQGSIKIGAQRRSSLLLLRTSSLRLLPALVRTCSRLPSQQARRPPRGIVESVWLIHRRLYRLIELSAALAPRQCRTPDEEAARTWKSPTNGDQKATALGLFSRSSFNSLCCEQKRSRAPVASRAFPVFPAAASSISSSTLWSLRTMRVDLIAWSV
jgi:hypothetical protein